MTTRRTFTIGAGAALAGTIAAPAVARAQAVKWRMVTSWPKRLPGPGMSAERVATRIRELSGGRLDIAVYAAGEVVPAFEVLDAVGNGVADIGHTASFYWQGKTPSAAFFTTVPFGLTPAEHVAWIEAGGGQAGFGECDHGRNSFKTGCRICTACLARTADLRSAACAGPYNNTGRKRPVVYLCITAARN